MIATSPEMLFGKMVGERLAADPTYLPEIPRRSIFEHEMRPMLPPSTGKGDPVPLVAFMDAYEPKEAAEEYKTGRKKWDKERVRKHGQVDFYLLGLYLTEGIKPETIKFRLHWMPTHIKNGEVTLVEPFKPLHFKADRTFAEILLFWKEIEATRQAMIAYYAAHR